MGEEHSAEIVVFELTDPDDPGSPIVRVCAHCGQPAPTPLRVRLGAASYWLCSGGCAREMRNAWTHRRKIGIE